MSDINEKTSLKSKTTKSLIKVVISIIGIFILIVGGCGIFILSLANGMCRNEIFQEVYSPDNEYKAVVFKRGCGTTTGYETQISILRASDTLPNKSGNIFTMDGHPDWTKVKINWETSRSVSIKYSTKFKVFHKEESIRIIFTLIEVKYKVGSS